MAATQERPEADRNHQTFDSLPDRDNKSLQDEAEQVTPLRGASSVDVEFDTY